MNSKHAAGLSKPWMSAVLFVAMMVAAVPAYAQCPCGNTTAQEYGDAVYRYLKGVTWANMDYNHTGIFAGMSQADGKGHVLHAHGVDDCIVDMGMDEAITYAPSLYYGAYTLATRTLSFEERKAIVEIAASFVGSGIDYTFWDALQYWGTSFDGTVADIAAIRCDGLTEYCYERAGFRVWYNPSAPNQWDISRFPNIHNSAPAPPSNPYVEMSPWAQRGAPTYYSGDQLTTNTDMLQASVISYPTYQVTQVTGVGYADVTIRATDESGIHRIAVMLPGASEWTLSDRQPQHPTSDSYSYTVRVSTEGSLAYFAMDNGGNMPATGETVNVVFTGSVSVNLGPASTVSMGAQWRVDGGGWQNSGALVSGLNIGNHQIELKPVAGWVTPLIQTVNVVAGQTSSLNVAYAYEPSSVPQAAFVANPTNGLAPLQVQFADQSTPGLMPITSWAWNFGDGTGSALQNPLHEYAAAGTYSVSLAVSTEIASSTSAKTAYITAKTPPTVDFSATPLTGSAPLTVQFTDTTQPGSEPVTLWAWDFGDGGVSTEQNPSHIYASVGTYSVTLTAGASGNMASATKTAYVTVGPPDTTKPVITMLGGSTVTMQGKATYTDAGATATDNVDGNITAKIVTVNSVNTAILGTYTVTYNVSDAAGNAALQKTRTVKVVDTTKPVLKLNGGSTVTVQVFGTYTELGATATDTFDGNLTPQIVTTGSVNTSVLGTYYITYTVKDSSNNTTTAKRTVKVVDTTKPVLKLNGSSSVNVQVFGTYTELGATATDNLDGDLTAQIVTAGSVNTSALGAYYVTYTVTDSSNNTTTAKRTVKVVDTTKPVITMLGTNPVTIQVFDAYTDAGVTATDNYDGDVTAKIVTTGTVNTSVIGTYYITYTVKDAVGNTATAKRTIKVVDKVKPVITMLGSTPMIVTKGSTYTDAGATAVDNYDGDITAKIVVTNPVNTATIGTYYVKYNVKDISNNAATAVTRTVKVVAGS